MADPRRDWPAPPLPRSSPTVNELLRTDGGNGRFWVAWLLLSHLGVPAGVWGAVTAPTARAAAWPAAIAVAAAVAAVAFWWAVRRTWRRLGG